MKISSKRVAQMAEVETRRLAAVANNDAEGFATAIAEMAELHTQPDVYTCLCCGNDFSTEDHVDLLVASVLIFSEKDGVSQVTDERDYGILATERGENGRRIKICGNCASRWAIPILEYLEMR
jgi:hypothetical protein